MGTKNLAVPSILKCQTGLGKAAESVHFWQTADEETGERWVQRTDKSHLQNSPGFGWKVAAMVSLWAFFWGQCVGQRAFPGHCQDNGHRTRVEVKVRDVRRHRRMQRFMDGQAAAREAQNAPNPASSSWHLSSSHKMTAGFQQEQTRAE